MLKAWNTGHPGGAASVHANDAHGALIRLESLVAEATSAPQQQLIAEATVGNFQEDHTRLSKWASSNPNIVTVDATGMRSGIWVTRWITS